MLMEARLLDERREGIAEGIAKGEAMGIVKGEAMGIAKGEAMGIANANTATAKGCYSLQDIAELTSLSIEQVEALKAEQT